MGTLETLLTPRQATVRVLRLRAAWDYWQAQLLATDDDDRLVAIGRCLAELEAQMRRYGGVLGAEVRA